MKRIQNRIIYDKKDITFLVSVILLFTVAVFLTMIFIFWLFNNDFHSVADVFNANTLMLIGFSLLMIFTSSLIVIYLLSEKDGFRIKKDLLIIYLTLFIAIILCVLSMTYISLFFIPIAFCSVTIQILINKKTAICVNFLLAQILFLIFEFGKIDSNIIVNMEAAQIITVVIGVTISYIIMVFISNTGKRIELTLRASLGALFVLPVAFTASLLMNYGAVDSIINAALAFAGTATAIILMTFALPIYEGIFKISTVFKLNEYCSFNNDLLKQLAEEAPGTFNHSLMVGSLAESCAIAIGENPQLARAAAYYHDIGKLISPNYFTENQTGTNPHDALIPEISVEKIIKHATHGYELLKKYKYPPEIRDVTLEHHGTSPVIFFYNKALGLTEGKTNMENYSYKGPKPTTKISAIIMICDAAEAAARAIRAAGSQAEGLVEKLIREKTDFGQFDDCPVTMRDLDIIKKTVAGVLTGIYHTRISYNINQL